MASSEDYGLKCVCGHCYFADVRDVDTEVSTAAMDSSPSGESNLSIADIRK